jgi:D-serine deaminase-like pyridoxal phosphate-dependent protein
VSAVSPGRAAGAVGAAVAELETPALVVDLDVLERNLSRAAAYADEHALGLHPHVKTHKTLEIARMQLDAGAAGLTVAKSGEAEIFAGLAPILVHYPVFGAEKVARLVAVARSTPLSVAVDSLAVAEPLSGALVEAGAEAEALIELDVGMGRTGVDPLRAVELARAIDGLGGGLRVSGLSCYPGHLHGSEAEIRAGLRDVAGVLRDALGLLEEAGIAAERVSAGSTATLYATEGEPFTELRPGNYALLDRREAVAPFFELSDCALRVWATVVSVSVPGMVILDCGSKALSEAGPPQGAAGLGAVVDHPELEIEALSEEHAHCRITTPHGAFPPIVGGNAPTAKELRVGDHVEVIPNHACTCVNLHDVLYGARGGVVEMEMPVIARGMVR